MPLILPYSFGTGTVANKQFFQQLQIDLTAIAAGFSPTQPQGRLSLTSGTSVTTSDVTGATTLYYTPSTGRYAPINNGTQFENVDLGGELSNISTNSSTGSAGPAAVGNSKVNDLFLWLNGTTPTLTRGPDWSSDTSRGTGAGTSEIEMLRGIWVNKVAITNGPAAQRGTLVGSVRSDGSAQWRDTAAFRWVSNIYNVALRKMMVEEATDSWSYSTDAFRQVNASSANQLDFLQSLSGNMVIALAMSAAFANALSGSAAMTAIDLDTLDTANTVDNLTFSINFFVANVIQPFYAFYSGVPGQGRHILIWKERGAPGTGPATITWFGDATGTVVQCGIHGEIFN